MARGAARRARLSRRHSSRRGRDDGFNESARLIGFLNGVCGGEFFIANLARAETAFPPHRPARRGTVALDQDAAGVESDLPAGVERRRIPDLRLEDALLGAGRRRPRSSRSSRQRFGGAEALQADFANYVDQMRIGSGHGGREVGAGIPAEVVRAGPDRSQLSQFVERTSVSDFRRAQGARHDGSCVARPPPPGSAP